MQTFTLHGRSIELAAWLRPERKATAQRSAWLCGTWLTVLTGGDILALRVHLKGREIETEWGDRVGSSEAGAWLLIDDVVLTSRQIVEQRALPAGMFSHVSRATIRPNTLLNIGIASPLYGFAGGGWQAEWVGQERVCFATLPNIWHGRTGTA